MSEEDRVSITPEGLAALQGIPYRITLRHHAETQAGWTQDWSIEAVGSDLPAMAEQVYNAHSILLDGPEGSGGIH